MSKAKPGQSNSTATKTKAGKKSGAYVAPPAVNVDKQAARYEGEKQFIAKEFPQPLPSEAGSWDAAMDLLCGHFGVRRRRSQGQADRDNGIRFDASRGRLVYPPRKGDDR